jgi:hypothetical protein
MRARVLKWSPGQYSAEVLTRTGWRLVDDHGRIVGRGGLAIGSDRVASTAAEARRWAAACAEAGGAS